MRYRAAVHAPIQKMIDLQDCFTRVNLKIMLLEMEVHLGVEPSAAPDQGS